MNTEDSEFARIEREQAMRNVPDAIHHTDTSEPLMYIQGWNDCRASMLAAQPAPVQEPVAGLSETQAKAILVLALDLEWTGRAVETAEGQVRTDFVNRNRNIQCALEDALRNATTPQAQRKPLTDEQLRSMCKQTWVFETVKQWARVIEAAHNIKENQS